jgi:hypothetical protein
MSADLPLDDRIGQTYYIQGAPWRYLYNKSIGRFALRRVAPIMAFDDAVKQIASGELLWHPPQHFERLRQDSSFDIVQKRLALLQALRSSPSYVESTDWELRTRVEMQIAEARAWLSRRAITSGDAGDEADKDTQ